MTTALPYIDEHTTIVVAEADVLWQALTEALDSAFDRGRYARLVGCADVTATGPRPLTEGSTLPGFRVSAATPTHELVLTGSHRYSVYALIFHIDEAGPGRYLLRAESRAAFPGLQGRVYRRLVIGTGAHAMGMRRLLASIRTRTEKQAAR
ncbi:hypothetical protein BN159_7125 [Streptomyces davaonensis JCM 4913]|uniref:DUF2867 domain-containing protein n=1 Tax=Streptomyces davaonensis (strain DSM 101723 / JCM 4913 / KCC S-0913 / 768) TaxID=1214101 RepID=K4REP1_STRDJ|nr:hypothetical protein [Streptomyces davaonensis]CCK31504.1 hypothetical protein BN159_7125 [Streptomyces davaonensis JCM 4913]